MNVRHLLLSLCLGVASTTHPAPALADTASDKAAAEALFEQGRSQMEAGQLQEACKSFEASQRLDSGLGTLLYLADCYEQAGRTASAWATFREAASLARGRGDQKRASVASSRADALEARLPKLWLVVADGNPPDLTITRDGSPVPRETWGLALPMDPGEHEIVASAPGKKTWTGTVSIEGDGASARLEIPVLVDLPPKAAAPATATEAPPARATAADTGSSDAGSGQRVAGLVVGGVGIVGVVVGSLFGLDAFTKNDDSLELCDPNDDQRCTEEGKNLRDDAERSAMISNVAFGVGAAALATGVVLYITAPSTDESETASPALRLRTRVSARQTGLSLQGSF